MRTRRSKLWWYVGTMALASVAMLAGAQPPQIPPRGQPDQPPPPPPVLQPIQPTTTSSPDPSVMEEPLRLIGQAAKKYQEVTDYTCTLVKRERIKGEMQPENVMHMSVRAQPFSVYMKFEAPRAMENQEVCYVAGKNKGMMRVHAAHGFGAIAGFVSIDPNDPRAKETSQHNITEAGIGNLIDRATRSWDFYAREGNTEAHVANYKFNDRPVTRVELVHPEEKKGFPHHRSVMYFDKEQQLPVRIENYSWPVQGGPKDGELIEVYNFVNLKLNVGLPEGMFNK